MAGKLETAMDYETVETIAKTFDGMGDVFRTAAKGLEAAIIILKATAFISLGATEALAAYLSNIKPHVEKLGNHAEELNTDLRNAIKEHREADQAAAGKFG